VSNFNYIILEGHYLASDIGYKQSGGFAR